MSKGYRVVAPDRYLTLRDEPAEVTVRVAGVVVARSARAARLAEGDRPEVLYLPREDVDGTLVPSPRRFECRWKGPAQYFHLELADRAFEDAAWGYPSAPDDLAGLRERVAFDPAVFDVAPAMASADVSPTTGEAPPAGSAGSAGSAG